MPQCGEGESVVRASSVSFGLQDPLFVPIIAQRPRETPGALLCNPLPLRICPRLVTCTRWFHWVRSAVASAISLRQKAGCLASSSDESRTALLTGVNGTNGCTLPAACSPPPAVEDFTRLVTATRWFHRVRSPVASVIFQRQKAGCLACTNDESRTALLTGVNGTHWFPLPAAGSAAGEAHSERP